MTSEAYITKQHYSQKTAKGEPLYLSMLIGSGSFMFVISTNNFKNVVELCHVEITHHANAAFNLTEKVSFLVNNYLLHQKKFEKVNLAFLNSEFTMLPEAFSVQQELRPLLEFTTGTEQVKNSLQHHIKNLSFCYTLEPQLLGFFERTFPNASIRHAGAVAINLFFSQHSLLSANLFLTIGDGWMELAAKQNTELLFYNVFNFENNEDILYYLLFTMEQFDLNPLQVKLIIAGQRPVTDELFRNIKKYIKSVGFCILDPSVNLNGDLSELPKHYYFTLLNQHVCEL